MSTATLELLSRFLDGELTPSERRRVERLLEDDADAQRLLEGLSRVRSGLSSLPELEVPPHLGAVVRRGVVAETEERTVWQRLDRQLKRWSIDPSFLPALAVIVAVGTMLYLLAQGTARIERDGGPLILSAPPGAELPIETTAAAGRELRREGELWIEIGADTTAPARVLRGTELDGWLAARPELAELRPLGVVVIEVDGEVVRLDFAAD